MLLQLAAALAVGAGRRVAPAWHASRMRDRRGPARRRLSDAVDALPFSYVLRNLAARTLTTVADRRRHGARRVRVRDGADARRRPARNAGHHRARRTTSSSSGARRRPRCRAASTGVQAGIVESLPDIAIGPDGAQAGVEGAGGAHQPAQARERQALERRRSAA